MSLITPSLITLGIESSCDETGIALYQMGRGLLAHALYTQVAMHNEYGGVVPELASRDHVRRVIPLVRQVIREADVSLDQISAIAYTQGPGLGGALLVGASVANALAYALDIHTIGCGGGSRVRLDAGDALRVGPESAGADPGPACYGRSRNRRFAPTPPATTN